LSFASVITAAMVWFPCNRRALYNGTYALPVVFLTYREQWRYHLFRFVCPAP
jgi:hypothetical protein